MSKGIGNIDREFNAAIVWMLKQRGQTDIVVVSDGRSDCARMEIRTVFEKEICEECDIFEFWVVYEGASSFGRDPSNPKRKLAWSSTHTEVLFVSRPSATRGQRKIVSRDSFTKCGGSTNYSRSYTGSGTGRSMRFLASQGKIK